MHWSARPFVRILLFYVLGILLAYHLEIYRTIPNFYYLVAIISLLAVSAFHYYKARSWKYRWLGGAILGFSILLSGIFFTNNHFRKLEVQLPQTKTMYIGTIVKQPSISEHSVKTIIKVTEFYDSVAVLSDPVKVMAYFAKDSMSSLLNYGDKLLFLASFKEPGGPKNPGEFDYGAYLLRNGISAVGYVQNDNWEKLGNKPAFSIFVIANKARLAILEALRKNGLDDKEFGVAAAVLVGYDDQLDTELEADYVRAGAMHILCVSGLHVGIVYIVINFLLGFLKKGRIQVLIKTILLLLFIWAYAMITGLAPSVLRSSVMLSILIVGNAINRHRDQYNTLAIAAVTMLVYDPMLLFNLGFQLSFSAVLGILIFFRPIYTMIYVKNPILDKIWSIVVVSTAAQLGTFPLAAHYFHYLPTYFWLTNILIFPLSFVIIGGGMFFIIVSWLPYLPYILGWVLSFSVYLMNHIVGIVKYLPGNGFEDLYFPWVKVVLVYGLIFTLYNWLLKRNIRYVLPSVLILLLLMVTQTIHKYKVLSQNKIIVYSLNKHSAIDLIQGGQHAVLMDSILQVDQSKTDYHLKNGRIEMGLAQSFIEDSIHIDLYSDEEFYSFNDFTFMLLNGTKTYFSSSNKISIDALIVQGKEKVDLEDLQKCINFKLLVLDGSVPYWKKNRLIDISEKTGIQYYDVTENGAFIHSF